MAEEQDFLDIHAGEEFTTPEQTLRRSTMVRRVPHGFEYFFAVVIEDEATMEKTMGIAENGRWQKAIKETLKSTEDGGTRTKTALPPEKNATSCKMVFNRTVDDKEILCQFKTRPSAIRIFQKEGIYYHESWHRLLPLKYC